MFPTQRDHNAGNRDERPPEPSESLFWKILHYLPQTVFVSIGFAYVTGFLTTFTFLERFGVREAGADFLKIKYVHVGILALFFPFGIVAPIMLILSIWRAEKEKSKHPAKSLPVPVESTDNSASVTESSKAATERKRKLSVHLSNAILLTNMMLAFYVLVLFAEPAFFQNHELLLPSIFVLTLVGVVLVNVVLRKEWMQRWSKWLLVVGVFLLQLSWLGGMSGHLAAMLWGAPSDLVSRQFVWASQKFPFAAYFIHGMASNFRELIDVARPYAESSRD